MNPAHAEQGGQSCLPRKMGGDDRAVKDLGMLFWHCGACLWSPVVPSGHTPGLAVNCSWYYTLKSIQTPRSYGYFSLVSTSSVTLR